MSPAKKKQKTDDGSARIAKALDELGAAARATQDAYKKSKGKGTAPYSLDFGKKYTPSQLDKLEKELASKRRGFRFPASYRWLVTTHGLLELSWGKMKGFATIRSRHMFEPRALSFYINDGLERSEGAERSIEQCVAFQYESTDSVENFYCFGVGFETRTGELPVLAYYHDEPDFDLTGVKPTAFAKSQDFTQHILAVIADMTATCEGYEP